MRQNVADLLGDVISCLDWRGERNRVVTSSLEWPGSLNTWSQLGRLGGEAVVVPGRPDGVELDLDAMVAAIDERTLLVECSHVLFRTSTLVDVAPLVARAHEVGALVLVDGYQAAGTVPVDVVALGVDLYMGGSVKYLSGGPGNGWLYAAPHVSEALQPVTTGWFGTARPFDFDPELSYAPGIGRFAGGTPGVPAAYAAAPAYEALAEIGMQRVRERSVSMTQPLLEAALERGFTVRSPHDPAQRGGHVTIDPGDAARVHDELHRRGLRRRRPAGRRHPGVAALLQHHRRGDGRARRDVGRAGRPLTRQTGGVTAPTAPPAAPARKKQRGRESVGDMVRSLGLVMLIVVPVWFLAQPPDTDEQAIRVVDPSADIAMLRTAAPGVPVPGALPPGWQPDQLHARPAGPAHRARHAAGEYAEYAASARPEFLTEITGGGEEVGTLPVAGQTWRQFDDGDEHTTLVRVAAAATVVVGGRARDDDARRAEALAAADP